MERHLKEWTIAAADGAEQARRFGAGKSQLYWASERVRTNNAVLWFRCLDRRGSTLFPRHIEIFRMGDSDETAPRDGPLSQVPIERSFFARSVHEAAPDLIGATFSCT